MAGGIRRKPIGDDDRARLHGIQQKHAQCGRFRVGDDPEAAPPKALRATPLNGDRHQGLARGTAPSLAGLDSANGRLVHLDLSAKPITPRPHHRRPEAAEHGPGGLVRAEAEEPVKRFGRDPALRGGHIPGHCEPHGQRRAGAVEDGPCRHGHPTALAPEPAVAHPPTPPTPRDVAARAHKAVRPPQPLEIVEACIIVTGVKPAVLHSWAGSRVQLEAQRLAAVSARRQGTLPHLDGYHPN